MSVMFNLADNRWKTKRRLGIANTGEIINASRRNESTVIEGREYTYIPEMSLDQRKGQPDTTDAGVYVDRDRQHVVIAFEGTDKSQINDLIADVKLWAGLKDEQFEIAEAHTRRVMQFFGQDYTFEVVGHSLGAAQASYVSGRLGIKSTGFNDPGIPKNFLDKCDNIQMAYNSLSVQVDGDPISGLIREPAGKVVNLRLPDRPGARLAQRLRDFFRAGPSADHPEQLVAWQKQRDLHNPLIKGLLGGFKVFDDKHDASKMDSVMKRLDGNGIDIDEVVEKLPPRGVIRFDGRFTPEERELAMLRNRAAVDRLDNPDGFAEILAEANARADGPDQCPLPGHEHRSRTALADNSRYAPEMPRPGGSGGMTLS